MNKYFNKEVAFSSNKTDWETPQDLFDRLNRKYNFTWDLAASDTNAKCSNYLTIAENSLNVNWSKLQGNLFLNPPYGRDVKWWVKKAYESSLAKTNGAIVLLIPSRTDTSYWHDYILQKAEIQFLRGRVKFEINGQAGQPAPFPSAIIEYSSYMQRGGKNNGTQKTQTNIKKYY